MLLRMLSLLVLAFALPIGAQDVNWMRYPSISPDGTLIVFTWKGDLYRVATSGGLAVPLTAHPAHDIYPVWSPDSKTIVFASNRYGNYDLFSISANGGEARRLTYHSAHETPFSFTSDGKIVLFSASRGDVAQSRLHPTGAQPELYQVGVDGGRAVQLLTTPAEAVSLSSNDRYLLYMDKAGNENIWRKHHRSAVTRDIWLYDRQNGSHTQITSYDGEDRTPVFAPGDTAFYYLSEEEGTFNVRRWSLSGASSSRITSFTGAPVRFLSVADNGTLAFGHDGLLYTLNSGSVSPQRVSVDILADNKANNELVLPITGGTSGVVLSPNGKEVAYVFRGDVFVTAVEGGTTKQITRTPAVEHGIQFSPDGKKLVYASERWGRWSIYEATMSRSEDRYFHIAASISERALIDDEDAAVQNFQPVFSPDGSELAYIENFNTLRVYTLNSGNRRTLAGGEYLSGSGPSQYFTWSPDGKWILFNYSRPGLAPGEVGLVSTSGRDTVVNLTQSGFSDSRPRWVLNGSAMIWRSNRDGLRSMAEASGGQADVYAMYFTQDAWDRSRLTKAELALLKEAEDASKSSSKDSSNQNRKTDDVVTKLDLDLGRAIYRKVRLTTHSSSLGDALLSKDGETLYYLAAFERGQNLWSTSIRTGDTKMVLALNASGQMAWDKDEKKIIFTSGGGASLIDPATGKRDNITIQGEMLVDASAERESMFAQLLRKVRDTFYRRDYHGADWEQLGRHYSSYLPYIGNGFEFAEMLSELLGELNVSHSGANFSQVSPTDDATSSLGIITDPSYTGAGIPIVEVLRNGPMDRAGLNVQSGAVIEAIDGVEVDAGIDHYRLLNRKSGKLVLLRVREGQSTREIVVKPVALSVESNLLYRRWVERNVRAVDSLSGGRLGYIHVPGMNDGAYRTAFEEVMGRFPNKEALVIDTRWNGGGDLVADLDMFLSGRRFFSYTSDTRATGFEPNFRWTNPSIVLAGEGNYSDGHCFPWTYQTHGIGKLVGMPVPGTCTFAGGGSLLGGVSYGAPSVGVKDSNSGRYLENWQTEPDIRVRNEVSIVSTGRDQQLESAVAALLEQLSGR